MSASPAVVKTLMSMSVMYEKHLSEDAADMLLEDLKDFPEDRVLSALRLCRRELNRFPTVAEIIKRMSENSEQSQTQNLIGEIFKAIRAYGYNRPTEAREDIGPVGWRAIQNFGGWQCLCDYPADSAMALRAQLRQAVEAAVDDNTRATISGERISYDKGDWSTILRLVQDFDKNQGGSDEPK